jgi:hypothetical protein
MLGPIELILVCIVGLLLFGLPVAVVALVVLLNRTQPAGAGFAARPRQGELWESIARGARITFPIAVFLVAVLGIAAPLAWVVMGHAGMPLVRLGTIGILLAALYAVISVAIALTSKTPLNQWHQPSSSPSGYDPVTQADLVARITQRFCPRCRAPLAADAPEGLCAACLMAGGFASNPSAAVGEGFAATSPFSGSHQPTAEDLAALNQAFPQLEILDLLGRGGMGAVFKARQKHLDRVVALKVIPPEAAKDPAFAERFAREARALARLHHPNIVMVYDFGQNGDIYYLLMEYVDGVDLRRAQHASRLSPTEALAIVPQICDALQYAHDQGVVHRDIKPENVLLDRAGHVKIADFGLAKMLGKSPDNFTLTATQQVMGTPRYMAPEQIEKPTSVDHRADIYSLGVVLYEMLTGELPIGRFQPPSQKVQLDVRIDHVVLRALEKEPDRRYQRASEVKTELASAGPPMWQSPAPATKYSVQTTTDREAAKARVQLPAIGLMIAGFIGLFSIAAILLYASAMQSTPQSINGQTRDVAALKSVLVGLPPLGVVIGIAFSIAFGGWKMSQLQSYGLVTTSAMLAMLPCTPAWMISFPMGIWALIVLSDPKVRAAFGTPNIAPQPLRAPTFGQPATLDAKTSKLAFVILIAVAFAVCAGIIPAGLIPMVYSARQAASRAQSSNNLKQLGLALHNYHDVYGSFPPAVVRDADGNPLYSGRVLLLPFLAQENVYRSFDLTQAWNSPRNEAISDTSLPIFMDPSDAANQLPGKTNYLFVSGKGTMFPSDNAIQMSNIIDGLSNTIAMVEMKGSTTHWAQPEDLDFSVPRRLPPGSGLVLIADGSVRQLDPKTPPLQIREAATIGGGEMPWSDQGSAPVVAPPPAVAEPEMIRLPAAPAAPPPGAIAPPAAPAAPAAPGALPEQEP